MVALPEAGKKERGFVLADPEVGFKRAHILRHKQKYQLGSWDYGSREQRKCLRLFRQRYNRRREGLGFNRTPAASVIHVTLIYCLFILHLSYVVMSCSLFPIFISLVSHHCLPSALLVHLLLCLTAHLLTGKHFSVCLFWREKKNTQNFLSSRCSFYCLYQSLHAANTQSRLIKVGGLSSIFDFF